MGRHERLSGAERVARRRAYLRGQGFRPKQFWVPDLRSAAVRNRIRREAAAIAASRTEAEDQDFIDSVSLWNEQPDGGSIEE